MLNPSDIHLRLATPADLPLLTALIYESFVEYKSFYTDEGFAATTPSSDQLLQRMNEGPVWIATKDGVPVGTVSAVGREDHLYIRGMAVLPQARGFGLGALLLRSIEDFALVHGHKRLTLSTTPFLTQAIRLYERSGFGRTTDGPHDLYGTPLFTMVKDLKRLERVYWIGGGSAAGKSTIARRLAAQHGLRVYATDEAMADHARRSTPEDCPLLHAFMAMDMDERWVNRTAKTMFETFHWFHGEGFNLIVEDLLSLPPGPAIIVEGFRLLPRLVKPLLSAPAQAVWLLPTPAFRQAVVESRGGSGWGFLARTSDPERALRNMLERDRMFTEVLRDETTRLGLPAIEVDTTTTEDDLVERVTEAFGL